jgi:hypothetical protein
VANNLHRSDDETYSNTHRYPLHSDPDVVLIPPLRTDRRVCNRWVTDFHGALTVPVLMEYIELDQVVLQPDIPDEQTWRLSPTGQFSTKSAYVAMFQGAIPFEPTERVWKTWAPSKCKFLFGWWSTIGVGLLTSLKRRDWTTLSNAHFVTSSLKLLTISWSRASSLGKSRLASFNRWAC